MYSITSPKSMISQTCMAFHVASHATYTTACVKLKFNINHHHTPHFLFAQVNAVKKVKKLKMKLFDPHCHLQDPRVRTKAALLIKQSVDVGVVGCAVNGTSENDWCHVKESSVQHGSVVPCFGLHPWFVSERSEKWFQVLKQWFEKVPEAAVGEIGLDKIARGKDNDYADQVDVFRQQLKLAKELRRPVSVHCVQAFGDLLEIMKSIGPFPAGVLLHSYMGSAEMVPELAKLGSYFSASGHLMGMKEEKAKQMLKAVPSDRILLESDAPDALPRKGTGSLFLVDGDPSITEEMVDYTGDIPIAKVDASALPKETLNHPANIYRVLDYVASLLEMDKEELAELTYKNTVRLFSYEGSKVHAEE